MLTIGCQCMGRYAVLAIVCQWHGLLCSPLCVSRACCAHHCESVVRSAVLAIECQCCARHLMSMGESAVLTIGCQWVHQWEGLLCSP